MAKRLMAIRPGYGQAVSAKMRPSRPASLQSRKFNELTADLR